jgi:hypothetical protein
VRVLRLALFAALLLPAASLTGCGTADCTTVCEDTEFCPNGEDLEACTNRCAATEATAERADCGANFQTFLDCMDGADDPCSEDSCVAEGLAYVDCARSYCEAHVGEAGCTPEEGRGCDATEANDTASGCEIKATCADGFYKLTCDGAACVCSKEGGGETSVALQPEFCEAEELATRVDAARAACGWPTQ